MLLNGKQRAITIPDAQSRALKGTLQRLQSEAVKPLINALHEVRKR